MQSQHPDEATFPVEPIDQAMKVGYLAATVDQSFGLDPMWRED